MDAPTATIIGSIIAAATSLVVALITSRTTLKAARLKEEKKEDAKSTKSPKPVVRDRRPRGTIFDNPYARYMVHFSRSPSQPAPTFWADIASFSFYGGAGALGLLYYLLSSNFPDGWTAIAWTAVGVVVFAMLIAILVMLDTIEGKKREVQYYNWFAENQDRTDAR